jgi:hypothetical protein
MGTADDQWYWYPSDPEQSDNSLSYDMDPGEIATFGRDGEELGASRIRIWAVAESGKKYLQNKTEDLWLVPETTDDGEHCYYAAQMQPFTMAFTP